MPLDDLTVTELLDSIGAKTPTPGGGAVASVIAGLSAALARMVVNYSVGKKTLADHDDHNRATLDRLTAGVASAMDLAEADARAFEHLSGLWKLASDDPRRVEAWDAAVEGAIAPPRKVMHLCASMLDDMDALVATTNTMLASDLAIAAILAEAGLRSAAWNVRINLPQVSDADRVAALEHECASMIERAAKVVREIEATIASR